MIDILLATYNCEKYLRQQIDSIISQTNQNWQLLIRDDESVDGTISIIEEYTARYHGRIKQISDDNGRLGACRNFGELLKHSTAQYIMFSDQDDVWLPNKIESTLMMMINAEKLYPDKPLLVHTDLRVVDCDLNLVADSRWFLSRIDPAIVDDVNKVMVEGVVTGCTMMINKRAKDVSLPIPKEAAMHDHWISIKVAKYGKIVYSSVPSILYRQHLSNAIGSGKKSVGLFIKNMFHFKRQFLVYKKIYRMSKAVDPSFSLWKFIRAKTNLLLIKFFRRYYNYCFFGLPILYE